MMLGPSHTNLRAWAATGALAAAYLGTCVTIRRARILPNRLSRKLIHIGTGPLYLLCWPLYSTSSALSPWVCATVPLTAAAAFAAVGSGAVPDFGLVPAVARDGADRTELLRGPLQYGLVHAAATVLLWRQPAGVAALAVLCGGDGLAEPVGAALRSPRLPWSAGKTAAGTAACFAGGAAAAAALLRHFAATGMFALAPGASVLRGALLAAAAGAAAESLPAGDDNVLVAAAAALAARAYFGGGGGALL